MINEPKTIKVGKPFYESKGIQGATIVIVVAVAKLWGWHVDDSDAEAAVLGLAGIWALIGRITAKEPVTLS